MPTSGVPSRGEARYARRRSEATALHQVVRDNLLTLYAAIEDGFAPALPAFVKSELQAFVDCGVLQRGFAVFACPECGERKVVAFSCAGRGFCPSCLGRGMAQTAANLLDHVIPKSVPLRQWVLTVPFELRARLAFDRELLGGVGRVFVETVQGFYTRTLAMQGVRGGQSGSVTVVQRVSSDLRLNPNWHVLFLDGVFVLDADGEPRFHTLPLLSNGQVGDVMQAVRIRVLRYLARRGVIDDTRELTADSDFAEREPVMAALASASVSGLLPAGPERRERIPVELRGEPGVAVVSALSVAELLATRLAVVVAGEDAVEEDAVA